VFGQDEKTQGYARLEGKTIRHPKSGMRLNYEGESTLIEWITQAATHTDIEKGCVDELVAVNPSIIDLEMGLPAAGARRTAPRMDCVALEHEGGVARIVFWEAKRIDDSRLRSTSDPEVVEQIKLYRDYLNESAHVRSTVENAYRTNCHLLVEIFRIAAPFGEERKLDNSVFEAARGGANLKVDPQPRLVIFGGKEHQKKGNWPYHENRLWKDFGIPYLVFEQEPYVLRRPEMKG
jgi:hypothetical protein